MHDAVRARDQAHRDAGQENMTQIMVEIFNVPFVSLRPAPVVEYIFAAPAVHTALPVVEYILPALAVSYVAPVPAVYAARTPVFVYISPAPVVYPRRSFLTYGIPALSWSAECGCH